jgi:hypothetical protein
VRDTKKLLSARRLDDVPPQVRIGSPRDAPDRLVFQWAKQGVLHPGTNYGVVFRVAFAARMEPDEEPVTDAPAALPVEGMPTSLVLRFGWVVPPERFSESGDHFTVAGSELRAGLFGAWVLLTNQRLRWHYAGDGVPQVHPGIDVELGSGVRQLLYGDLQGRSAHQPTTIPVSGMDVEIDFFIFEATGRFYAIGFGGAYAPENLRWYDYVTQKNSEG